MNENRGLWRGKRVDNGEWVEGYFVRDVNEGLTYICKGGGIGYALIPTDPSTLGECTGLTDKNGKLIFEGDIIDLSGVFDCESAEGLYKVVWDDAYACFYFESIAETPYAGDVEYDAAYGEVVGNIHDNPGLIQKGAAE